MIGESLSKEDNQGTSSRKTLQITNSDIITCKKAIEGKKYLKKDFPKCPKKSNFVCITKRRL